MTVLHVSFLGKMKDSADAHGQNLKRDRAQELLSLRAVELKKKTKRKKRDDKLDEATKSRKGKGRNLI